MIFPDVAKALAEMARVTRADGTVGVRCGGPTGVRAVHRRGLPPRLTDVVDLLSTYFNRGDVNELSSALTSAGLGVGAVRTEESPLRFPSVDAFDGDGGELDPR